MVGEGRGHTGPSPLMRIGTLTDSGTGDEGFQGVGDDSTVVRLLTLTPRQQLSFSAACAEVLMPESDEYRRRHGLPGPNPLRDILDRLWALATNVGTPDVWDDADAAFDLIPSTDPSFPSGSAGARAAALAVHHAVVTGLVEQPYQAVVAMDQAVRHGPPDASSRLGDILASLEAGVSPEHVRREVSDRNQ